MERKRLKLTFFWVWEASGAFFRSSFSDVPGASEHILATPGVLISGAKHSPPSLCAVVALWAEIRESQITCDLRSKNETFSYF